MIEQSPETIRKIEIAADLLREAKIAVALTGAGSSTPSGIPDFRSPGSGLWTRYLPMEVASLSAFRYDHEKFFSWLRPLASHMLTAEPNPAHYALAQLESSGHLQTIITQNIDTLHQRAGSNNVLEVHGTMETMTCIQCYQQVDSDKYIDPYIQEGTIPRCPKCEGVLKPDVVLFEEQLPVRTWLEAQKICETCDLMLVAGTSLEVMPVSGLPMRAVQNQARLIVVNKSETYIDPYADVIFYADIAEIIPRIAKEIIGE
jgi:NAD-dependent deacetylase